MTSDTLQLLMFKKDLDMLCFGAGILFFVFLIIIFSLYLFFKKKINQ